VTPRIVRGGGADFAVFPLGEASATGPLLIWAHGWGHTHAAFAPLAQAMRGIAPSVLIDFPGFGASPLPPGAWGTADYADAVAEWLPQMPAGRRIWIGHSFGCRVGLRLAARHPGLIDALFLVAAAGLAPRRSLAERVWRTVRRRAYRCLRNLVPDGPARERLRQRFGSADYRQAGILRPILVKTVGEDLAPVARQVTCPTMLVYGEHDSETPPELGERFRALMPQAELAVLRGLDHWTVLTDGQHQIAHRLSQLVERRR